MAYRTMLQADDDVAVLFEYGVLQYGSRNAEAYVAGLQEAFELLSPNPSIARERFDVRPPIRLYRYQIGRASCRERVLWYV